MQEEEIKIEAVADSNSEEVITAPKKSILTLPTAIIISGLFIASAILLKGQIGGIASAGQAGTDKLDLVSEITPDDFVYGNEKAETVIIEYADFSCKFCSEYHPTLKKVVDDSDGEVKWVYRHLPIFNIEAAVASTCVGNTAGPTAFWDFAGTLFQNSKRYSTAFYEETALATGANLEEYRTCISDPLIKSKINDDFRNARLLLGISATPNTIIIDKYGRKFSFSGALPYEDLSKTLKTLDK